MQCAYGRTLRANAREAHPRAIQTTRRMERGGSEAAGARRHKGDRPPDEGAWPAPDPTGGGREAVIPARSWGRCRIRDPAKNGTCTRRQPSYKIWREKGSWICDLTKKMERGVAGAGMGRPSAPHQLERVRRYHARHMGVICREEEGRDACGGGGLDGDAWSEGDRALAAARARGRRAWQRWRARGQEATGRGWAVCVHGRRRPDGARRGGGRAAAAQGRWAEKPGAGRRERERKRSGWERESERGRRKKKKNMICGFYGG